MLGVSLHHRGDELLAPIASLARYRDGHVTGIPFLHPWANRLSAWTYTAAGQRAEVARDTHVDQHGLPIHGTIAGLPFDVVGFDGERLSTRLDATALARVEASFPFPHAVELMVELSNDGLAITTMLLPSGDSPVPASFGFHPYFRLPGARRAEWELRLPPRRHIRLDDRQLPTGEVTAEASDDRPIGSRTFDDHYSLGPDRRFELRAAGRRLIVEFDDGFGYAQVYAPPRAGFVCIEPMVAPVNALVEGTAPLVEPGTSYQATWRLTVA
jgi:galactose mutarotase-like enzyme